MDYFVQQLVNGLVLGSMYALVAIGFSMIYGIVRLINFAHGDLVMVGAFAAVALTYSGVPWPVIAVLVLGIGIAAGMAVEALAFRPIREAPQVTGFIGSLALSILIQNTAIMALTAQPRSVSFPEWMRQRVEVAGANVSVTDVTIVVSTLVLMAVLVGVVKGTRLGMAMRATAENLQAARLMGVRINRTIMSAFAIGSGMAAFAGLMWAGRYGQVDPLMGFVPGLKAFVAAVIGGVGSIAGAMLGGYILGLSEVLFVGLLPQEYASYRDAFVFGLLIVVLLVMPNGLLGKSTDARA